MSDTKMKHWVEENTVVLHGTFAVNDVPDDPDDVLFRVKIGDGSVSTFTFGTDSEVTNPSVGTFECRVQGISPDVYKCRMRGEWADGTLRSEDEVFKIDPTEVK